MSYDSLDNQDYLDIDTSDVPAAGLEIFEDGTVTAETMSKRAEALKVIDECNFEERVKKELGSIITMPEEQKDAYVESLKERDIELGYLVKIALLRIKYHFANKAMNAAYHEANVRAIEPIKSFLKGTTNNKNDNQEPPAQIAA